MFQDMTVHHKNSWLREFNFDFANFPRRNEDSILPPRFISFWRTSVPRKYTKLHTVDMTWAGHVPHHHGGIRHCNVPDFLFTLFNGKVNAFQIRFSSV